MTHYSNTGNPIDFPKLSTIDKLWGQALDRVVPDTYSSLSLTQVEKVKTVFAELIVRECTQTLRDNTPVLDELDEYESEEDWDRGYGQAMKDCVHHIQEHFGVES